MVEGDQCQPATTREMISSQLANPDHPIRSWGFRPGYLALAVLAFRDRILHRLVLARISANCLLRSGSSARFVG